MGLFIFISSPLSNNVLKSHCFNSWDSYRRPLFTGVRGKMIQV